MVSSANDSRPSRKSWLRFSLASLFLLTALVCVTTAYLLQRAELRRKEAEIRQYRIDLGLLDDRPGVLVVDDPKMVHVAALPSHEPLHWRWRIYLPPGTQWMLFSTRGEADGDEFRGSASGTDLRIDGEFTLEAYVRRDLDGHMRIDMRWADRTLGGGIFDQDLVNALKDYSRGRGRVTAAGKQESFAPNGRIPLVKWTAAVPPKPSDDRSGSAEPRELGLSIYLEEGSVMARRSPGERSPAGFGK